MRKAAARQALPRSGAALSPAEIAQAERLIAAGQGGLARALLQAALEDDPHCVDALRLLAVEALSRGDALAAIEPARHALRLAPRSAFLQMLVGRAHKAAGELDAAIEAYRRAIVLDPQRADAHVSLGIALKAVGDLHGALACHQRALEIQPELPAAHANLGVVLASLIDASPARPGDANVVDGSDDAALDSLRRAVEIDGHRIEARHNLCVALARRSLWAEAAEHFNAALALDPRRQDSCIGFHAVLMRQGLQASAREVCERWLALNTVDASTVEVVGRLVCTLLELGELDAARPWIDRAVALAPERPDIRHNLANLLVQSLDVAGAVAQLDLVLARTPSYSAAWSVRLMCLNYIEDDPLKLIQAHRQWGARQPLATGAWPAEAAAAGHAAAPRRLRVGWVSGDLRRHSVGYFMEPLFAARDREQFEWIAYYTATREDEVSARMRTLADAWVSCDALNDEALAARIRADRIDILVDLSGHTADSRPGVFARRPAPLQISYLGYPTTTGQPATRLRISDPVIDPATEPEDGAEQVLRMPRGMFCYRPDIAPPLSPLPALHGGAVTFGSFNNLAKMSPQTLALWARVLHAVPLARLMLKARALSEAGVRLRLLAALADHGITADRVLLAPWAGDLASHLALYEQVDVALDTLPYNGATTTCEALWMGVPVLTLPGRTHASRVGASILGTVGLHDWVADDADGFVTRAQAAASDLPGLANLRAELRQRLQRSPLLDAAGQTQDLERLLAEAWSRRPQVA